MHSVNLRRNVARPSRALEASEMPLKILIASADHRGLCALKKEAREAGYSTIATGPEDTLASLLASKDTALVLLAMRHSRQRCALGHLRKWCFPRVPLILISASISDYLVCDTCPARCHSATANENLTRSIGLTTVPPPAIKGSG